MSNQPIIYLDGVRIMDDAFPVVQTPGTGLGRPSLITVTRSNMINPNDIERIEIIKGSAATTLYGTEASAGVIQVFTKRVPPERLCGRGDPARHGLDAAVGAPGGDFIQMEHYMRDAWWGGGYEGGEYAPDCVTDDERWRGANSSASGACSFPGAVWFKNYLLSVRGGGQDLQYFISGQYRTTATCSRTTSWEKYNSRGNFTMSPAEDLQIQWNTGYTSQWLSGTPSGNNAEGIQLTRSARAQLRRVGRSARDRQAPRVRVRPAQRAPQLRAHADLHAPGAADQPLHLRLRLLQPGRGEPAELRVLPEAPRLAHERYLPEAGSHLRLRGDLHAAGHVQHQLELLVGRAGHRRLAGPPAAAGRELPRCRRAHRELRGHQGGGGGS